MNRNKKENIELLKLLKHMRLKGNFSQLALAKKMGVSQSFISKYESGERRLDIVEVMQICKVLNISFTQFVKTLESEINRKEHESK